MLTIRKRGHARQLAQQIRAVPRQLVPYAAAAALTRTASHAVKKALPAHLRKTFRSPTPWTLGSTRFEPATAHKLRARVAVKNRAAGAQV